MSALLKVDGLTMHFPILGGVMRRRVGAVHALTDVSFEVREGETLGIVGESGCGKSTLGRAIVRLYQPTAGKIHFRGEDVTNVGGDTLSRLRHEVQMIFQDPYSSLNPRMTIRDHLEEPLRMSGVADAQERSDRIDQLLRRVGLREGDLAKYPHEFSGGQRQRIDIARALVLEPSLVIADEPVSALDVSIQSQVLNLLSQLQRDLGLTYLFISHNLAVVDYISDHIAVMCRGRLVELAPRETLFRQPIHPYTRALLSAVPYPDPDQRLDLGALMEGKASEPEAWPRPFTINGASHPVLVDIGAEHFVRADREADLGEYVT